MCAEDCLVPPRHSLGVKEDSFNVLDLAEYTKNRPWWRKVFAPSSGSSAEKYNVATQLLIGGVTGWCSGCYTYICLPVYVYNSRQLFTAI
ncbi:fun14 hypothetical protein [Limosa lapponica baueri]|uniref:FUN14 domain-containing protein 2 n=1 Tax=Limosa lapponica baueri TaxID=1758121 RepID=A0A2I0TU37_LIMLA|nr:fun14 hypothetical protein [Limosa lapponica baueri]